YKTNFNGYDVSIQHIGGNYNYGIYNVLVLKEGKIIYTNKNYYYMYINFGATYSEVIRDVFRKLNQ
ncbi:MAG: hypothetical protein ACI4N3_01595, partial [Alphaproteobacteria bacterium]